MPWAILVSLALTGLFDEGVGIMPIIGLVVGLQLERRQSYGVVIASAAAPAALYALLLLNSLPEAPAEEQVMVQLENQRGQLEAMGLDIEEQGALLTQMAVVLLRVVPAAVFLALLLQLVLAYRVGQFVAPFAGTSLPLASRFSRWRPWSQLIWVLILGFGFSLGGDATTDLGLNLLMVMGALYGIQGMALIHHYAQQFGLYTLIEVAFYGILFVSGAVVLLPCIGLLDTWFDWRRIDHANGEDGAKD